MSNLLGNGNTLRRMYVPPSVFVVSSIGSALVNLTIFYYSFLHSGLANWYYSQY